MRRRKASCCEEKWDWEVSAVSKQTSAILLCQGSHASLLLVETLNRAAQPGPARRTQVGWVGPRGVELGQPKRLALAAVCRSACGPDKQLQVEDKVRSQERWGWGGGRGCRGPEAWRG